MEGCSYSLKDGGCELDQRDDQFRWCDGLWSRMGVDVKDVAQLPLQLQVMFAKRNFTGPAAGGSLSLLRRDDGL